MSRQKFKNNQEDIRPGTDGYSEMLLNSISSCVGSRQALNNALGYSFAGDRDVYEACGYKKDLTCQDYYSKYLRDDIASTIVDAYPEATWSGFPAVQEMDKENEKDETTFEKAWGSLVKALRLNSRFLRADRLTGLGHYAVLVLGFGGQEALSQPVAGKNNKLIYVQPYSEKNCTILKFNDDESDERFGLPEMYEITPRPLTEATHSSSVQSTFKVHWTHVIHLVEKPLDNEVYGLPRLEVGFNRLMDILKIAGGSGEGIWRGAFPGHAAVAKDGFKFEEGQKEAMTAQFDEYRHNLRRILTVAGVDIKNLDTTPGNPKQAFDLQIALLSAAYRIPQRILTGSERGELASSQDESNWNRRVDERKEDFGTDVALRPFIDRLIEFGALPAVDEYSIVWPSQDKKDPKVAADIAKTIAEAVKIYIEGSVDLLIPPSVFLRDILNLEEDIIEKIEDILGRGIDETPEDEEEEDEIVEEEEIE